MFPVSSRPWHELQQIRASIICRVLAPAPVRGPRVSNWLLLRIICISWSVWDIYRLKRSNWRKPLLQPCHSSWTDKTWTRSIIKLFSENSKSNITACVKQQDRKSMTLISIFVTRRLWADKEYWLSDVWCGREGESCVSSEGAGMVGGTPVSLRLWNLRISQLPRAVWLGVDTDNVYCPRLSAEPDITFQHIPQPLCWLSESSRMCRVSGVMASRLGGSGSSILHLTVNF